MCQACWPLITPISLLILRYDPNITSLDLLEAACSLAAICNASEQEYDKITLYTS